MLLFINMLGSTIEKAQESKKQNTGNCLLGIQRLPIIMETQAKVLHHLLGNHRFLSDTSNTLVKKMNIGLYFDNNSINAVNSFKRQNSGIYYLTHSKGNFTDYLPFFLYLGEDILSKTIFYVGKHNLQAMQKEFPNLQFRSATFSTSFENKGGIKERKDTINQIDEDMKNIETNGGYVFIIPSGEDVDNNEAFKGIFRSIIKRANHNTPVLASQVEHTGGTEKYGYKDIGLCLAGIKKVEPSNIKIKSFFTKAGELKGKSGTQLRKDYNNQFGLK